MLLNNFLLLLLTFLMPPKLVLDVGEGKKKKKKKKPKVKTVVETVKVQVAAPTTSKKKKPKKTAGKKIDAAGRRDAFSWLDVSLCMREMTIPHCRGFPDEFVGNTVKFPLEVNKYFVAAEAVANFEFIVIPSPVAPLWQLKKKKVSSDALPKGYTCTLPPNCGDDFGFEPTWFDASDRVIKTPDDNIVTAQEMTNEGLLGDMEYTTPHYYLNNYAKKCFSIDPQLQDYAKWRPLGLTVTIEAHTNLVNTGGFIQAGRFPFSFLKHESPNMKRLMNEDGTFKEFIPFDEDVKANAFIGATLDQIPTSYDDLTPGARVEQSFEEGLFMPTFLRAASNDFIDCDAAIGEEPNQEFKYKFQFANGNLVSLVADKALQEASLPVSDKWDGIWIKVVGILSGASFTVNVQQSIECITEPKSRETLHATPTAVDDLKFREALSLASRRQKVCVPLKEAGHYTNKLKSDIRNILQ